jgi:hypothetical protein
MNKKLLWRSLAAAVISAVVAGNFHFVHGSKNPFGSIIPKVSWSLSETIVNFDAVGNMPGFMARGTYPLFMAAVEKMMADSSAPIFSPSRLEKITLGMASVDVEAVLGKPDSSIGDPGKHETYRYFDPVSGRSATLQFNRYILFEIGK